MENSNIQEIISDKAIPLIKKIFSDNLNTVIIYGSAASGNLNKFSDINTLILLNKNSPSSIIRLGKEGGKILKKYKITPLILTIEEFFNSSDVFPMEYNDILQNHSVAYGDSTILDKLDISGKYLRHQLEERLRGLINQLRQMLVASGGSRKIIRENLLNLPGILTAVFRSALRLKQIIVSDMDRGKIFSTVKDVYNTDFSDLLIMNKKNQNTDVIALIENIMKNLAEITAEIDRMDVSDAK